MISINVFTTTVIFLIGFTVNTTCTKLVWPKECTNKTYCHVKPDYYPENIFKELLKGLNLTFEQGDTLSDRDSEVKDVAGCMAMKRFNKLYLLLDDDNEIRYIPQMENAFVFKSEVEECWEPGPVSSSVLDEDELGKQRVDCHETKIPFKFPVLSLDGAKLVAVAPKGGLPVSCSAKVMIVN